ncbi:MAG: glucose 1-dehydrogenase [Defluviitaleaceae bacterium]|nr:glucose 1-dehydrogenase [Defluviitaleaceae bacterium]
MISEYLTKMFSLEGKTALVTGAGGGIGKAIALGFAKAGAHVALCDINMEALNAAQSEIESAGGKSTVFRLDVCDISGFNNIVSEIGKISASIDILVNCAGMNKREGLYDVTEETYDRIMDINLKGVFFLSQAVAPYMKKQKGGVIINIGSHNTGAILGGCSVYGASKSGMASLTRSMATEWAKYNIRANSVSPGHIKTDLTTPTWEHPGRSKYLLDRIALARPGTPEDVVGVCVFLASEAAAYITGCEYRVDGGCISGGQPWDYDTEF